MAKKGEWIQTKVGSCFHVNSWSSDSDKYLLKVTRVSHDQDNWIVDVMGLESFLVVDEVQPDKVKKLARVYLRQVLEKIVNTFDMNRINI